MSSFCGVRRTAVQMPMLRGSRGGFFSVSEAPDAASRVHVHLACMQRTPSCSLDDQYIVYSANAVYNVYYGHLKSLDLARESKTF